MVQLARFLREIQWKITSTISANELDGAGRFLLNSPKPSCEPVYCSSSLVFIFIMIIGNAIHRLTTIEDFSRHCAWVKIQEKNCKFQPKLIQQKTDIPLGTQ